MATNVGDIDISSFDKIILTLIDIYFLCIHLFGVCQHNKPNNVQSGGHYREINPIRVS